MAKSWMCTCGKRFRFKRQARRCCSLPIYDLDDHMFWFGSTHNRANLASMVASILEQGPDGDWKLTEDGWQKVDEEA